MSVKLKNTKKSMKSLIPKPSKKVNSEVNRVLNSNMRTIELNESDIPFIKSFVSALLREQGRDAVEPIDGSGSEDSTGSSPDDFTPERNQSDFENSLNPETENDNFEVRGVDPSVTQQSVQQIKVWADKLDEFANFLNDPDKSTSLHRILADSDRAGSVLRGITRKATDSITRIAGEVEKLKEVLNTFIITAPKKQRDAAQTTGPIQ